MNFFSVGLYSLLLVTDYGWFNENVVFKCIVWLGYFWTSYRVKGIVKDEVFVMMACGPELLEAHLTLLLANASAVFQIFHIILRSSVRSRPLCSRSSALDFLLLAFCSQLSALDFLLTPRCQCFASILRCRPFALDSLLSALRIAFYRRRLKRSVQADKV